MNQSKVTEHGSFLVYRKDIARTLIPSINLCLLTARKQWIFDRMNTFFVNFITTIESSLFGTVNFV